MGSEMCIRDSSTEVRRAHSYERQISGEVDVDTPLEEYTLVDGAGRVQLPREYLDEVKIRDRARVMVEDGKVTIVSGEE